MYKQAWRVASAIALITAIGCGGGDENGPTGSIQLSASPSTLTLPQGGSGTVTVTLVRGGGFADPVNVAVTGLPSGVTLSVTPAQLTGTTTQAVVTVNVANTVPAGTYTATVTATATGIGSTTATYTLTVTALPNFALTATPAALSIGQGGSGTSTINVQRTNLTTPIALTLVSPPAGITGSFNPASATGDQSTLTINVASTVATGNYTLTVNGHGPDPNPDRTTTIALTVTPPPDYSLSTTPSALTINAGGNSTTTVNITRTNFTGAVTLSLDAPPAGITATFNPAAPTGTSSVATISVASTVVPGNYNVTIKGTASGVPTMVVGGAAIDEAAAAGDRTTTVAVTVAAAPNFTISATPAALSITPGTSGNSSIAIVRTNLASDVALTLVSPPTGITGVFTPATLSGATLTSTLALSVAANVTPGVYPVTVQGVGGSLTKTTVVNVTVATGPSVALAMNPTTLTIEQGSSSTSTLNATRSNYTGDITPSVTGNPAGMTVTFSPNPITGGGTSSTATVNVGSGVAVGQYNLTITGSTGGAAGTPTTTLQVSVTAPTGNNIVWEFCNSSDIPLKFWRLSGSTWTEVAPTVVGSLTRFSFTVSGTNAGIAFTVSNTGAMVRSAGRTATTQRSPLRRLASDARKQTLDARARITSQDAGLTSPFFDTYVLLGLSSELAGFSQTCTTLPADVTKNFTLTGQAGTEEGLLGYGTSSTALVSQTSSYNVMVPAGTYDYMAMWGPSPTFPSLAHAWSAYRIGRGEAAPGASVALNRTGATAFTQTPFTVTGGAGGSFYSFFQFLEGARGPINSYPIGDLLNSSGNGTMLFLAAGDRLGTDMNAFNILNTELAGNVTAARSQIRYFGSAPPTTTTYALPQAVPAFTTSQVAGAPVTTWQVAGTTPTDYQGTTSVFTATFEGQNNLYTLQATRGWMAGNGMSTSYTLGGPTLPGFLQAWAPSAPLVESGVIMAGTNLTSAPIQGSVINLAIRLVMSP